MSDEEMKTEKPKKRRLFGAAGLMAVAALVGIEPKRRRDEDDEPEPVTPEPVPPQGIRRPTAPVMMDEPSNYVLRLPTPEQMPSPESPEQYNRRRRPQYRNGVKDGHIGPRGTRGNKLARKYLAVREGRTG